MRIPLQKYKKSDDIRKKTWILRLSKRILIRYCGFLSIGIFPEEAIVDFSRKRCMIGELVIKYL